MLKAAARIFFFFLAFPFRFISERHKPLHPLEIVWDLSVIEKEVYWVSICTQSRSLMYHELPESVGFSSLEKGSPPGAGAEKGCVQKQKAYFLGEVKSLIFKATSSKQLISTRSAEWIWGEMERHCLSDRISKKQLTSLPQTQRFGASNMIHPG